MKLLLLAGEESGVLYAEALRARLEGKGAIEIRGYADYGFRTGDLAVMGFWAVLKKLFYFLRVKRTMERAIDEWCPDVVCTIDYPGMNLKLAAYAKAKGIRAVHVVCPQVWAWKRGRIPKIEAALDRLCCFFPFEPGYFRPGFAKFVGHPLADSFPVALSPSRRPSSGKVLALLPGSRIGEIEKHLGKMLAAAKGLDARMVIPAANARARKAIERIAGAEPVEIVDGRAQEVLRTATCAVVASGTATLEAALARCPTVLVYDIGRIMGWIARRLIRGIHYVGLANIIWEKSLPSESAEVGTDAAPMPELLQEDFTAAKVRGYLERWLKDPAARAGAVAKLDGAMKLLQSDGSAMDRIAAEVLERT